MTNAFKMTLSELSPVKLILETATRQWLLPFGNESVDCCH